jgi:hypothetical protein
MSKARDIASAAPAPSTVSATEIGYLDGVTSAVQTQIDGKEPTLPSQTGNSGKYLTTNGTAKSWGTVSQYALPSQTGNSGKYLTTNGTAESWGTVTLPTTWTQRAILGDTINSIGYNGTNLYVAVGSAGLLMTSSDGITWTTRTSGFGANYIAKVAFGNGLWVAVGNNGTITTSTDGITWTARTSNVSTNELYDVHYANSIWVAVAFGGGTTNTGGITYSTDGITWTRKSQSVTVGSTYYSVIYNGTNWIVGASNQTNNFLYASTPSGTWTVGASGSAAPIHQLFYDGTRTFELTSTGALRFSTSATFGTTTLITGITLNTTQIAKRCFYYNGKIYSTGTYNMAISSTPASGNYATITDFPELSPLIQNTSSGDSNNKSSIVFANATGIILGGQSPGLMLTSF